MVKSLGRRMIDVTQKARGRQATKYEFEIIPYFVGELPSGVEKVMFAWERSNKLFVTEAEPVNPHTRAVFWKQYLKQTVTMYLDNGKPQSKEYTFKIQSVKNDSKGSEDKKTIGKTKVDLSSFCTQEANPAPQEIFLQLKPHGKLKVSIKACWLKDAPVDFDAMTEASSFSKNELTRTSNEEDEQDLTGFDDEHGSSPEPPGSSRDGARVPQPSSLGPHRDGAASPHKGFSPQVTGEPKPAAKAPVKGVKEAELVPAAKEAKGKAKLLGGKKEPVKEVESPRIAAAGGRSRHPDEIPGGWQPPLSPEEKARLDEEAKEAEEQAKRDDYDRMVAEVTAKLRADMEEEMAARSSWCCCCPPQRRSTLTRDSVDVPIASAQQPMQEEDMRR